MVIETRKCKRCGKVFVPAPLHKYRIDTNWFCSYTCHLHESEERNSRRKKTHGSIKNKTILKISPIDGSVVARYYSNMEAANAEGISHKTINNWLLGKSKRYKTEFIFKYEDENERAEMDKR
jgi:hypothetical protein